MDWIQIFSVRAYATYTLLSVHSWFLMLYNGSPLNVLGPLVAHLKVYVLGRFQLLYRNSNTDNEDE